MLTELKYLEELWERFHWTGRHLPLPRRKKDHRLLHLLKLRLQQLQPNRYDCNLSIVEKIEVLVLLSILVNNNVPMKLLQTLSIS
jgi:hypothetical protein